MPELLKHMVMVVLMITGLSQPVSGRPLIATGKPATAALPARAGEFENAGLTLHYSVIGKGAPVVMLSGGPGFNNYMMPVAQMIAVHHQVILLDQRGTGKSRPPVVNAKTINEDLVVEDIDVLRRKLGVDRVSLVGHSFGTLTAMRYALAQPNHVDRLILLSTVPPRAAEMSLDAVIGQRLTPEELKRLAALDAASGKPGAEQDVAQMEIAALVLPAYLYDKSNVGAVMASMGGSALHADTSKLIWRSVGDYDITSAVAAIRAPVLIVQGQQDPLDVIGARTMADAIPGAKLVILEKCGHFAWIEAPALLSSTMNAFLAQHSIEPGPHR